MSPEEGYTTTSVGFEKKIDSHIQYSYNDIPKIILNLTISLQGLSIPMLRTRKRTCNIIEQNSSIT